MKNTVKQIKDFYHFDINSTTNCNLRCTYCIELPWFEKPEETPDVPLIQNIKEKADGMLKSDKFLDKFGGIGFFFWGGEPTLNPELIFELVTYFKDDPRVVFFIYSNGYNISKVSRFLEQYKDIKGANGKPKVFLQISYDGKASHDLARLTTKGTGSSSKVLKTIKEVQRKNIPHSIKCTIAYEDLDKISENYYEFRKLQEAESGFDILYNPTIDYLSDHNFTDAELKYYLDKLKEQVMIIAKDEIEYYKKHGQFFFGWLNPNKAICGAGSSLGMIDLNGEVLVCHGALYEENRNEHIIANINSNNNEFIDNILTKSKEYSDVRTYLPPECITCHAHYCMKCNVKKSTVSTKETYVERWVDYDNQNHICALYKYMGSIRISLLKIIQDTKIG